MYNYTIINAGCSGLIFQFAHFLLDCVIIDLGIKLSWSDVGVAQDILNDFQRDAVFKHVSGGGVAQVMKASVYVAAVGQSLEYILSFITEFSLNGEQLAIG